MPIVLTLLLMSCIMVLMDHDLFNHVLVKGHLGSYWFGTITLDHTITRGPTFTPGSLLDSS